MNQGKLELRAAPAIQAPETNSGRFTPSGLFLAAAVLIRDVLGGLLFFGVLLFFLLTRRDWRAP